MRVDAAVLQMAVPDLNATLVQEGGASLREDRACAARLEEEVVAALGPERGRLGMPELRGKQAVPPLWLTGSVANGMDGYNIAGLRTALLRAGVPEKRIVTDAWMPSGVCGGTFAEEAPWVFSRAAGGMVVEALRSVGLLVEHPGADLALRDYQPACANGTGRAGAPPLAACPEGSALLHPRHDLAWDNNGEIAGPLESATGQMMSALSFPHPLPTRGPLFYAAAGDPEFPAGATARVLRPHRGLPDCQVPSDADLSGRLREKGSKGKEECAFALDTWYMARQYVMLRLKGMLGLHEYTKGEHWDEMGGWMAGWAGEASQEG
ncbi:hypothetical protein DFJ74DRAFT_685499 [Hyaloraphidium curvatum]|nr:hypothetical protein DFJ74DRAFT_685499 [Hyaloraphidium curvatum]